MAAQRTDKPTMIVVASAIARAHRESKDARKARNYRKAKRAEAALRDAFRSAWAALD